MMLAAEHMADVAQRLVARRFVGWSRSPPAPRFRLAVSGSMALGAALRARVAPPFRRHRRQALGRAGRARQMAGADTGERQHGDVLRLGEIRDLASVAQIKVSMDGRRETVYPRAVYDEDQRVLYGIGRWDALLARGNPALVLMSRDFAADNLLRQSPDWHVPVTGRAVHAFCPGGQPAGSEKMLLARRPPPPAVPDDARLSFP